MLKNIINELIPITKSSLVAEKVREAKRVKFFKLDTSSYNIMKGNHKVIHVKGIQFLDKQLKNNLGQFIADMCFELTLVTTNSEPIKILFSIDINKISLFNIVDCLQQCNAKEESSLYQIETTPLPTELFIGLENYSPGISRFYGELHMRIKKKFMNIVEHHYNLSVSHKKTSEKLTQIPSFNIIFLGCGIGKELKLCVEEFDIFCSQNTIQINRIIHGIDINRENIERTRQLCHHLEQVFLHVQDANNITSMMRKIEATNIHINNTRQITVVICSGFNTREVNHDTMQVFRTAQQLAHHIDHMIIAGITDPLIVTWVYKRIGYAVSSETISFSSLMCRKTLYTLTLKTIKKICDNTINYSSNILNLSYKARITAILSELYNREMKFDTVNLSMTYIPENEIGDTLSYLKLLQVKTIIVTNTESWFVNVCKTKLPLTVHYHTPDLYYQPGINELYAYSPTFFNRLRNLPHGIEEIHTSTTNNVIVKND